MMFLAVFLMLFGFLAVEGRPDGTIACDPDLRPVEITEGGTAISSPGYDGTNPYPIDQTCEYRVVGQPGLNAIFTFENFLLEECIDCNCDRVEIYSGQDDTGTLIDTLCGGQDTPFSVGAGQDGFLRFVSDSSTSGTGFSGSVSFGDSACNGGQVYTAPNGTFTSPNYPSTYPNNADCSWTFIPPANNRVEITFNDFNLEESCTGFGTIYDYVDMIDSNNNRLGRWWGSNAPTNADFVFSSYQDGSERVEVTFTSDITIGANGFSANWRFVPFN